MALAMRGRRRHDRHLADAAHAVGMAGIRHLDHHRVDHRQVEAGRHPVVEEAGVGHLALVVVDVLLVQRPADALHGPALHLPLDVAGMDRLADVLNGGVAQDGHLARLGIDLDVDDVRGEGAADAGRIDAGPADDGAAGGVQLRRPAP